MATWWRNLLEDGVRVCVNRLAKYGRVPLGLSSAVDGLQQALNVTNPATTQGDMANNLNELRAMLDAAFAAVLRGQAEPRLLLEIQSGLHSWKDKVEAPHVLDLSINFGEQIVQNKDEILTPFRNLSFMALARSYRRRFSLSDKLEDLERSVECTETALELTPPASRDSLSVLHELKTLLRTRAHFIPSRRTDLKRVVQLSRQCVDLAPNHADRASMQNDLAYDLTRLFEEWGRDEDIEEAIKLFEEALGGKDYSPETQINLLYNLSYALKRRFERFGQQSDLAKSEARCREVLKWPISAVEKTVFEHHLGNVLAHSFVMSGNLSHINEAIELLRRSAAEALPRNRALWRSDLANALLTRYARTADRFSGRSADLDEAIGLLRAALAESKDHPKLINVLNNLAIALCDRGLAARSESDLDESVHFATQQVAAAGDSAYLPMSYSRLAKSYFERWRILGKEGDLVSATDMYSEAVSASPVGDPFLVSRLGDLGTSRCLMGESRPESPAIFDEGVSDLKRALVVAGPDQYSSASVLGNIGAAYSKRYMLSKNIDDAMEAVQFWQQATKSSSSPLDMRMSAAANLGWFAATLREWKIAVEAYKDLISFLPTIVLAGMRRVDQESIAAGWSNVAADAAASACFLQDEMLALEFLERGRAVIFSGLLGITSDMNRLRSNSPDLAERLLALRRRLEMDDGSIRYDAPGEAAVVDGLT